MSRRRSHRSGPRAGRATRMLALWASFGLGALPFQHLVHAATLPATVAPVAGIRAGEVCGAGMACAPMPVCCDAKRLAKAPASNHCPRPVYVAAPLLARGDAPAAADAAPIIARRRVAAARPRYLVTERLRL